MLLLFVVALSASAAFAADFEAHQVRDGAQANSSGAIDAIDVLRKRHAKPVTVVRLPRPNDAAHTKRLVHNLSLFTDGLCGATYSSWCSARGCADTVGLLKCGGSPTGLGNRMGYLLTLASLAAALGRPAVTSWSTGQEKLAFGGQRYYGSLQELRTLMELPAELHFVEDYLPCSDRNCSGHSSNLTDSSHSPPEQSKALDNIPLHLADSVPLGQLVTQSDLRDVTGHYEGVWFYWQRWGFRGIWPGPCVDRGTYVAAARRSYAQVRPRQDLGNPPARSYLALHVRMGDKCGGRALTNANATWDIAALVSQRSGLPWVVISESEDTRKDTESVLQRRGARVMSRANQEHNVSNHGAETRLMTIHASTRKVRAAVHSLRPVVRDFFAISGAAGVMLATCTWGIWVDSSFSSMAALTGDTPLLQPLPTKDGGNTAQLQALGNASGQPLRDYFFADQVESFLQAVESTTLRPFVKLAPAPDDVRRRAAAVEAVGSAVCHKSPKDEECRPKG